MTLFHGVNVLNSPCGAAVHYSTGAAPQSHSCKLRRLQVEERGKIDWGMDLLHRTQLKRRSIASWDEIGPHRLIVDQFQPSRHFLHKSCHELLAQIRFSISWVSIYRLHFQQDTRASVLWLCLRCSKPLLFSYWGDSSSGSQTNCPTIILWQVSQRNSVRQITFISTLHPITQCPRVSKTVDLLTFFV